MKVLKSTWNYLKPSETILVMFGVFLFVAVITILAMYRQTDNKFDGTLRYENLTSEQRRQIETLTDETRLGDSDSSVRFAERLREASSIGLGISLYLVRERVSKNRILTLAETMQEFGKSDLLPPSSVVLLPNRATDYGLVQTNYGIYYIRYSSAPLKVEILSSGTNGLADGATFILRVPDTSAANLPLNMNVPKVSSAGAWATVFEAPANDNHYIPPPFAPVQTFTAMNWEVRGLQQTELSAERMQELTGFLQRQQ